MAVRAQLWDLLVPGLVRGDLAGADTELAYAARRAEQLGFPQGPYSRAYARFVEVWVRIDASQLDRAGELATDLTEHAERHGFPGWRLFGAPGWRRPRSHDPDDR
jgi:hypothetical protein